MPVHYYNNMAFKEKTQQMTHARKLWQDLVEPTQRLVLLADFNRRLKLRIHVVYTFTQ